MDHGECGGFSWGHHAFLCWFPSRFFEQLWGCVMISRLKFGGLTLSFLRIKHLLFCCLDQQFVGWTCRARSAGNAQTPAVRCPQGSGIWDRSGTIQTDGSWLRMTRNVGFPELRVPHRWFLTSKIPLKWMMTGGAPISGNPQMHLTNQKWLPLRIERTKFAKKKVELANKQGFHRRLDACLHSPGTKYSQKSTQPNRFLIFITHIDGRYHGSHGYLDEKTLLQQISGRRDDVWHFLAHHILILLLKIYVGIPGGPCPCLYM